MSHPFFKTLKMIIRSPLIAFLFIQSDRIKLLLLCAIVVPIIESVMARGKTGAADFLMITMIMCTRES